MIDAKDLRIGNLIKWNDDGGANCFYKVHEIRPDSNFGAECISSEFAWFPDMWTISYTEAEGIPLTPEILEKCGFIVYDESDNKYTVYGNSGDDSDFFLEFNWLKMEKGYSPMIKSIEYETIALPIMFLHQLQNLYYALTNQELNITL